jgi:ubiquinone/menaquinone biosynthesis C-methylase UbiE
MSEFDQHAKTYASAVNDSIAFSGLKVDTFVRAKLHHLRKVFAAHGVGPTDRIVDVGCGIGTYEMSLAEDWPNIAGIDVSQESIAQARDNCPGVHFASFDGKQMPFDDWMLFLAEIKRILRPGGILAVFEHNPWNPLTRWAVERCVFDKDAVLLSMPKAKALLSEAGFKLQRSDYILSIPATDGLAGRIDRCLGSLPTGSQYMVVARKEA